MTDTAPATEPAVEPDDEPTPESEQSVKLQLNRQQNLPNQPSHGTNACRIHTCSNRRLVILAIDIRKIPLIIVSKALLFTYLDYNF